MRAWIIILCLFLTGCGFHLRGYGEASRFAPALHRIYLNSADPYGELARNLRQTLRLSGIYLACSPCESNVVLEVFKEVMKEDLLSVGGTQQTRQYNLILSVTFQITDPKGCVIVPPQTVSESRTLTIQSNQILGGSNEANTLYQQMRPALVFDIMTRLSSNDTIAALMRR